jgi:peptidoglycan/LPS O-acetylase OafA/YrhL
LWSGLAVTPITNAAAALVFVLPIAFSSWKLVEKPLLQFKDAVGVNRSIKIKPGSLKEV